MGDHNNRPDHYATVSVGLQAAAIAWSISWRMFASSASTVSGTLLKIYASAFTNWWMFPSSSA